MPKSDDVLGQWTLVRHLGTGGSGSVWLAKSATGRHAAVKILHPEATGALALPQRFERELEVARRVTSRRVAIPVDADLAGPRPFIAWEYVEGPTLAAGVANDGPLSEDDLVELARDLAEALRDLHAAGIVHRDVKPANILLSPTGAVLVDLGIAVLEGQTSMTTRGSLVGTPGWLTPEQLDGQKPTEASDVFNWACAVTLAATGQGPFGGDTLPKMMYAVAHDAPALDGVPPPLLPLVEAALNKDPGRRPQARRIAHVLNDHGADHGDLSPTASPGGSPATARLEPGTPTLTSDVDAETAIVRPPAPPRRRPALVAGVAGGVIALGVVGALVVAGLQRGDTATGPAAETTPTAAAEGLPTASPTPSPAVQVESEMSAPAPDPDDPGSYLSQDGATPALTPNCAGVLGFCLGNPVELVTESLGSEDQRYPSGDGIGRAWGLGDATLIITSDDIGSIEALSIGVREQARATTPIEGILVGDSTMREFATTAENRVSSDVLSGEGMTIVTLWVPAGGEGSQYQSVDISVDWDEPVADALLATPPTDVDRLLELVGERTITSFEVGFGSPFGFEADDDSAPVATDDGTHGQPPARVADTLAGLGDGWRLVDGSAWMPGAPINVVTGNFEGSATGRGMHAFFFADGEGYIGTDTSQQSETVNIAWRNDTTIAIEYTLYRRDDPGCCPTGGTATVRFHWDGNRLSPLDPIPPTYSEGTEVHR